MLFSRLPVGTVMRHLLPWPNDHRPTLPPRVRRVAEKLEQLDDMERLLRRVIALKPDHHHAYNALGYSLADRNERLHEARKLIEKEGFMPETVDTLREGGNAVRLQLVPAAILFVGMLKGIFSLREKKDEAAAQVK
mgnify:CR=1 FL=1